MYNIYFKSADGKIHHTTLASLVTARDVHRTLEAAGYQVLTECPI